MKFFYTVGSVALAPHIALEIAGADYEAQSIDFAKAEQQGEEYLQINPLGRVPALVTDQGVITETPAILFYIAQRFPEANLLPVNDPFNLAKVNAFNSYLSSTVHVAHAHMRRGSRWVETEEAMLEMKRMTPQTMTKCFQLIENKLLEGPWAIGEQFTISDIYLFVMSGWLAGDGVDIQQFPAVYDHYEKVKSIAAVSRLLQSVYQ